MMSCHVWSAFQRRNRIQSRSTLICIIESYSIMFIYIYIYYTLFWKWYCIKRFEVSDLWLVDLWTTSTFGKWFFGILDSGSPGPKIQSFPKTPPVSTAHGTSGTSGTSCTSTSLSTQNERRKCRKYRKCVKSERRCKACEKTGATLALWAKHSLRWHTHSLETSLCCKSCHSNATRWPLQ